MLHLPSPSSSSAPSSKLSLPKKRGNYNCGRCGLPKKGHVCVGGAVVLPPQSRRALSYDVDLSRGSTPEIGGDDDDEEWCEVDGGLVEVLRRLTPKELIVAAGVCRRWRDCVKRVWRLAEELRVRVSPRSHIGFVGSLLNKCSALTRLSLMMESDVDATVLACVAFSCPVLESLKISSSGSSINQISGGELGRFVADKRCLSSLTIEGCTNLGSLNFSSSSLIKLWLSDLYCVSKMVINCPNMKELSLDFTQQEGDSSDLISIMESLGRNCPKLQNLHVASGKLCNESVLALANASFRYLRMLSLVLGSKITDASVAAIVASCNNLQLLDMSGSKITDNGIGMVCNAFPKSLTKLLLALCPNITSSGIQFATAQLPHLQVLDCGLSLCDQASYNEYFENVWIKSLDESEELPHYQNKESPNHHSIYQKLIIKHATLKKLSLWGCSGLDALYLNCPELHDLNLNSCINLHPERLLLQCPNLESLHASGCQDMLIRAINDKIFNQVRNTGGNPPCKRLADASKRVQAPNFLLEKLLSSSHKCT